jgi:cytoskeletal protein RodZ
MKGFVMNLQPSEAEAGFDMRVPPTADPVALQERIDKEWAPKSRNMTYTVSIRLLCPSNIFVAVVAYWYVHRGRHENEYSPGKST